MPAALAQPLSEFPGAHSGAMAGIRCAFTRFPLAIQRVEKSRVEKSNLSAFDSRLLDFFAF